MLNEISPTIRKRLRVIVIDLDIDAYRDYLRLYYRELPRYSDKTILKIMHEWRLVIYLETKDIDKQLYIDSLKWLVNYYED